MRTVYYGRMLLESDNVRLRRVPDRLLVDGQTLRRYLVSALQELQVECRESLWFISAHKLEKNSDWCVNATRLTSGRSRAVPDVGL